MATLYYVPGTYNTFTLAIAAILTVTGGNLAGDGEHRIIETAGAVYNENPDLYTGFSNWSAADFLSIYGVNHGGLRGQGTRINGQAPGAGNLLCLLISSYTQIYDLAITSNAVYAAGHFGVYWQDGVALTGAKCERVMVYDLVNGTVGYGFYAAIVGNNNSCVNCAVMNLNGAGRGYYFRSGANHRVLSCSGMNVGQYGLHFRECTTLTVTNCIMAGTTTADFFRQISGSQTVTYCISEDATADDWGGAGNQINQDPATDILFTNVGAGTEDLHIASGSCAENAGIAIAEVVDDWEYHPRSDPPEIGCDEIFKAISGDHAIMRGANRGIMTGVG